MRIQFIHWLETHMSSCPYKQLTGQICPGCGVQRAFVLLLKGEIWESMLMYPALLPMLFLFVFLAVHLKFKFKRGAWFLMYNFILVAVLILVNYIVKLLY